MSESHNPTQHEPLPDEHADLTALADGSLSPERAAELEARIATSPELAAALAQQRQAVAVLRQAVAATEAPLALRERLERDRQKAAAPRRRRRIFGIATAGALAAVAVLAVMVGLSGGPGAPTVAEAAGLAAKPPTAGPPAVDQSTPQLLDIDQSGVAFPNWEKKFNWKAVGSRTDRLNGRETTTVFYRNGAKKIAYTIVSGKALDDPGNYAQVTLQNVPLKVFPNDGSKDVTWLRAGHSCVMSGEGVTTAKMLELASWPGQGAVTF